MDDEQGARWRYWVNLLGRVRFGKQIVAGKTISGFTIKAVGERLAQYGNPDGTEVRPGIARIAVDMETSYTTVRNAITVLERVGLIRLVTPGNRNRAAVYRLIIGANLIESVELWSPPRHKLEINRVAEKYRGQTETPTADPSGVSSADPLLTPEGSADGDPEGLDDLPTADASGTENEPPLTPQGSGPLTPQASATNHRPRVKEHQPENGDLRTEVAVPRASRPPCPHGNSSRPRRDGKPRCDECRSEAELAAAVAEVHLGPARCEHGLPIVQRSDGVACFACRRGISA